MSPNTTVRSRGRFTTTIVFEVSSTDASGAWVLITFRMSSSTAPSSFATDMWYPIPYFDFRKRDEPATCSSPFDITIMRSPKKSASSMKCVHSTIT